MAKELPDIGTPAWNALVHDRAKEQLKISKLPCESVVKLAVSVVQKKMLRLKKFELLLLEAKQAVSISKMDCGMFQR